LKLKSPSVVMVQPYIESTPQRLYEEPHRWAAQSWEIQQRNPMSRVGLSLTRRWSTQMTVLFRCPTPQELMTSPSSWQSPRDVTSHVWQGWYSHGWMACSGGQDRPPATFCCSSVRRRNRYPAAASQSINQSIRTVFYTDRFTISL